MTMVEVVVTMAVIGAIALVLTAAVTVTFRQQSDTDGNLNVARWEQALALWLPTDLASADLTVDDPSDPPKLSTDPGDAPAGCTAPGCTATSNALMLQYDDGSGLTVVSYRYGPADDGEGFVMIRVECRGGGCSSRTVLRDLAQPSVTPWDAGDAVPGEVISVSAPKVVAAGDPDAMEDDNNAVTVSVTVNGLPDAGGSPRSSTVSITAGSVQNDTLEAPTFDGPNFVEARSGCGGPHTLLVDRSGSVGGAETNVREGVESFVRAFEGTPTVLKVVVFSSSATTVGGNWRASYDLSEPADVTALVGSPSSSLDGDFGAAYPSASGGTDWQEALYRSFYNLDNGLPYDGDGDPSTDLPERVILFTDGLPTVDAGNPPVDPGLYNHSLNYFGYPTNSGLIRDQLGLRAWWRADQIAIDFRGRVDLIGVGVGNAFGRSIRVAESGWPSHFIPNSVFLGDLVAGQSNPAAYNPAEGQKFKIVNGDTGWTDVQDADVLTTSNFAELGNGLAAIALAECGGTLTVQARDTSTGQPLEGEVVFTRDSTEQVTTNRINKAGTFDVPFGGAPSADVSLVATVNESGYSQTSWGCRAGGVDLVQGTDWTVNDPGDLAQGIALTVEANEAVSCTLEVTP